MSSANSMITMGRLEQVVVRFLYWTRAGRFAARLNPLLRLVNVEIRPTTRIGPGLRLLHLGSGHRVFRYARLGANVVLGPGTIVGGKANLWGPSAEGTDLVVEDDVIFGAGSVLLCRAGSTVRIGRGTVLGANAVLTHSTGPWEIWAGNPAQLVGSRRPADGDDPAVARLAAVTPLPRRSERRAAPEVI